MDLLECRQSVTVNLANGLHMRPLSQIANCARRFPCDIRVVKGTMAVDAKSIFDLLTLNATQGTQLDLEANGTDACQAVSEIVSLFEANFEEDGADPAESNGEPRS